MTDAGRPTQPHPNQRDAWQIVLGQLQAEMARTMFETWVQPLRVVNFQDGVFTLGAFNPFARDWVLNRLKSRITQLLGAVYAEPVELQVVVINEFYRPEQTLSSSPLPTKNKEGTENRVEVSEPEEKIQIPNNRKMMLQRAYGSRRAKLIEPERGMFVTLYSFYSWLPLLGHSAYATILAARSLCYWNPMTGELRNVIETDMAELASRAAVSVRTVKDVLSNDLVRLYFLRYKVRRIITPNGVRTAGISLQVRMDDPLTPQDQELSGLTETEPWCSPDFETDEELDRDL
jgi:hypothetical protein